MEKLYGGIDIHKENLVGCIMDKDGKITREHAFPSSKKAVEKFLLNISSSDITIAIEACGMWRGIHKILTELGYEVKLANPKKTHDIAGSKKMDKIDAKTLADLLRTHFKSRLLSFHISRENDMCISFQLSQVRYSTLLHGIFPRR